MLNLLLHIFIPFGKRLNQYYIYKFNSAVKTQNVECHLFNISENNAFYMYVDCGIKNIKFICI